MEQPELPPSYSNLALLDHTEEQGEEPAAPWLPSLPSLKAKGMLRAWPKCRLISSLGLPESSKGRGTGMWPGWDQLVQETTSFLMHLGEEPAHSWAARGTYVVISML